MNPLIYTSFLSVQNIWSSSTNIWFSSSTLLRSEGLQYITHLSLSLFVCGFLIQLLHSNWLLQVMWHKNYWWHHRTLSTRTDDSTSLVTSVNNTFSSSTLLRSVGLQFPCSAYLIYLSKTIDWAADFWTLSKP